MKCLKTDAEKGFKRTMFELESVDPNGKINFENYWRAKVPIFRDAIAEEVSCYS